MRGGQRCRALPPSQPSFGRGGNPAEATLAFGRTIRTHNLLLEDFIFVNSEDSEGWNFLVAKTLTVNEWTNPDIQAFEPGAGAGAFSRVGVWIFRHIFNSINQSVYVCSWSIINQLTKVYYLEGLLRARWHSRCWRQSSLGSLLLTFQWRGRQTANKLIHDVSAISALKKNKYKKTDNGREREGVSLFVLLDASFKSA